MTSNVEVAINEYINVGVLTISDRCYQGVTEDTSGPNLVASVKSMLPSKFQVGFVNVRYTQLNLYYEYYNFSYPDLMLKDGLITILGNSN